MQCWETSFTSTDFFTQLDAFERIVVRSSISQSFYGGTLEVR